ncbi:hypothetical protein [Roseibium aestuarii]|uniref:Uncharacterized protein n=1 Tax=Roseibium aestuarii TaxID=2600299 RepID=A0ABW4JSV7_9HYPH|nr:hypothetical protein [Roseibium aestuarii]
MLRSPLAPARLSRSARTLTLMLATSLAGLTVAPGAGLATTVKTDTITVAPPVVDEQVDSSPSDAPAVESLDGSQQPEEATADAPLEESAELPAPAVAQGEAPEILRDVSSLPKLVARTHDQLLEAARSGDLERLRMVLEGNEVMPTLSLSEIEDPIDFLRESSGDGEGMEILAILADTLEAGFVHVDEGTPQEMYVWPYFAHYPLGQLSPAQKVELYRIVTAADFSEMQAYGIWLFYRVGIGPDGTLHYFVAGE